MLELQWILSYLLLGSVVGVMAGLLGIGGGGIMVPVLTSLFLWQGLPAESVVHLALGTSMASIIVTSISSLRSHHHKGAVIWDIVKKMSVGIIVGTFLATFIAAYAKAWFLALFFSFFMAVVSIRMFLNTQTKAHRTLAGSTGLLFAGSVIGAISALVSIGGGSLTVPYLTWQNIDMRKAIGTSAAIGLPIAIAGTFGYVLNGWENTSVDKLTFGYVYLPAVLLISLSSFFTAPIGVNLAHKLPVATIKKVFALLLILLSLKMLLSVL
jgi:uncharacterized membrane protein YfcA